MYNNNNSSSSSNNNSNTEMKRKDRIAHSIWQNGVSSDFGTRGFSGARGRGLGGDKRGMTGQEVEIVNLGKFFKEL